MIQGKLILYGTVLDALIINMAYDILEIYIKNQDWETDLVIRVAITVA